MSFFTSGFATMFNPRRLEADKKAGKTNDEKNEGEGSWNMLTDAYGRTYFQHSVTGEWTYGYGGGFVSPVGTVIPSPLGFSGGVVFTPSPMPGGALLYPFSVAAPARKKKDEHKTKSKGWWEKRYDDDGGQYWEHTVSKKTTYEDPYY